MTELFDPASDTWTRAGDLAEARYWHAAVVRSDGLLLIAGGETQHSRRYRYWRLFTGERLDPVEMAWRSVPNLACARKNFELTLLLDGTLLALGGSYGERLLDGTRFGLRAVAKRLVAPGKAAVEPPDSPAH